MDELIRERVVDFLAGDLSECELEQAVGPIGWLEEQADEATPLYYDVMLAIAELEAGHLAQSEFRGRLRDLATTVSLGSPSQERTGTASFTQLANLSLLTFAVPGRRREGVSA